MGAKQDLAAETAALAEEIKGLREEVKRLREHPPQPVYVPAPGPYGYYWPSGTWVWPGVAPLIQPYTVTYCNNPAGASTTTLGLGTTTYSASSQVADAVADSLCTNITGI